MRADVGIGGIASARCPPVHSSRMRRRFGNRPDEGILVQRFRQMELKPAAEALGLMLL